MRRECAIPTRSQSGRMCRSRRPSTPRRSVWEPAVLLRGSNQCSSQRLPVADTPADTSTTHRSPARRPGADVDRVPRDGMFELSLLDGVLLGAILAATDGAAVFALMRGVRLPVRLRPTLEGELGLHDAIAVLLVLVAIEPVTKRVTAREPRSCSSRASSPSASWCEPRVDCSSPGVPGALIGSPTGLSARWPLPRSLTVPRGRSAALGSSPSIASASGSMRWPHPR